MSDLARMLRPAFFAMAALVVAPIQVVGASSQTESRDVLLTVSVVGDGVVVSRDRRIRCGSDCSAAYRPGSLVKLNARPKQDATFTHWRGDCVGTASICSMALDQRTAVKAVFAQASPPPPPPPPAQCTDGIDNDADGLIDYPADPGCSSATDDAEDDSVPPPPPPPPPAPRYGVNVSVSGNGTVRGGRIRCGGRRGTLLACEALYPYGTTVVLRAEPVGRSRFAGWSGFCQKWGKRLRCPLRVTAPKTVAALFRR